MKAKVGGIHFFLGAGKLVSRKWNAWRIWHNNRTTETKAILEKMTQQLYGNDSIPKEAY